MNCELRTGEGLTKTTEEMGPMEEGQ